MEPLEIFQLLTDAPIALALLYLLIREQNSHAETRRQRDNDQRDYMLKYSDLAKQSAVAIEAVGDALRDVREVLKDIHRLTPVQKA